MLEIMATDTDLKLRSYLDANQRDREQMCRAILELHPQYSEVRPRHPLGGPDGGRDLQATDEAGRLTFGAVGFKNGANDSSQHVKEIKAKFKVDVGTARKTEPKPLVFVFMTNVALTMGTQESLVTFAREAGFEHCEIYDRERLRIELDSVRGLFVRFQYLNTPLSPAEQASFLSQFGEAVQSLVTTGITDVQKSLRRLLFLKEAERTLHSLQVRFNFDREYDADELGHVRAYAHLYLKEFKYDIFSLYFGVSDKAHRYHAEENFASDPAGLKAGLSGGQWEQHLKLPDSSDTEDLDRVADETWEDEKIPWVATSSQSSIGREKLDALIANYTHDSGMFRFTPRLKLIDLDGAMFGVSANRSLAEHITSIDVFANGFQLITKALVRSEPANNDAESEMPGNWTAEELKDEWHILRPANGNSLFTLDFFSMIPKRRFEYRDVLE